MSRPRICLHCGYATPDEFDSLPPYQRSVECSHLKRVLDFEIDCMAYCYGGTVGTIETQAHWSCADFKEAQK